MTKKEISEGVVHKLPEDLRSVLLADKAALERWENITSLARNEWVCWVISVKQESTRKKHVKRVISELKEGMRRPCCWMGCIHRKDKAISPSVKSIINRRAKSR